MSSRSSNVRNRKAPTKTRGQKAKNTATADEGDEDNPEKGGKRVLWNLQRTERLIEWLENNVEDRQRLFSD